MSVLWQQKQLSPVASSESGSTLTVDPQISDDPWALLPCPQETGLIAEHEDFELHSFQDGARKRCVLIDRGLVGEARIQVNGRPVVGGLAILHHQDEIRTRSGRWYYSAESRPEPFLYQRTESSKSGRRTRCAICRGTIEPGQRVVRCPGCGRLYHEIDGNTLPLQPFRETHPNEDIQPHNDKAAGVEGGSADDTSGRTLGSAEASEAAATPAMDKRCWTYSAACKFCEHPTDLSGKLGWRPGPEESDDDN